jgi:hypothetical protein
MTIKMPIKGHKYTNKVSEFFYHFYLNEWGKKNSNKMTIKAIELKSAFDVRANILLS